MEETPNKSNLSFSISLENGDLDDVDSVASSDSETTGLQIDVSVDNFNQSNKVRKQEAEDTSFIHEMEEEIEKQLDAKASKTKLTATNVKNLLKSVILNENVVEMVRNKLTFTIGENAFEPKLTRAKVKELAMSQPDITWAMTPVKNSTSEAHTLIEEEFSESDSDEEYNPEQDIHSDEEKEVDSSTGNDIDSLPSTPATPGDLSSFSEISEIQETSEIQYDQEGVFKVPNIPYVPTEEESIVHRTRSKLCLTETPLEQIEQQFVPPDITSDMYEWDLEEGEPWHEFLKGLYTEPLRKEVNIEDDTEGDPEYNILEDEELFDREEMRDDKAVKISKKELQNLMDELEEFADGFTLNLEQNEQEQPQGEQIFQVQQQDEQEQYLQQQQEKLQQQEQQQEQQQQKQQKVSKKKRSIESPVTPTAKVLTNNPMVDLLPVLSEPELPQIVNTHQRLLLSVQMSQHVQLMAQQFVMTYKHPLLHEYSKICKGNLESLITLGHHPNSEFLAQNLYDAIQLITDWEVKLSDPVFLDEYFGFVNSQIQAEAARKNSKRKYPYRFHPELIKLMVNSKALMHPQLLPDVFPTCVKCLTPYFNSEENLIALGLEQFVEHCNHSAKKFNRSCDILADVTNQIQRYLMPAREAPNIIFHIKRRRSAKKMNPIKYYYIYGKAPKINHVVLNKYESLAPKEQPSDRLSETWQGFVLTLEVDDEPTDRDPLELTESDKRKGISLAPGRDLVELKKSDKRIGISSTPFKELLLPLGAKIMIPREIRNPIVNMMHMPTLLTPQKDDQASSHNSSAASSVLCTPFKVEDQPVSKNLPILSTPLCTPQKEPDQLVSSNASLRNSTLKAKTPQQLKPAETESDAESAESLKACETDEEESRPTRLRMTTPRLAKIKSAQNMKLLAQTWSPKGSTSAGTVIESKEESPEKNEDDTVSTVKGDNEDEIAELMLASTTIKKNATSRKKTKLARELENMKRLVEAENNINEEERATKFAASFIQKIHNKLESQDPELYKTVFKLFIEYDEMLENLPFSKVNELNKENEEIRDQLAVKLYKEVGEKLKDHPELFSDFLLFLTPRQAAMISEDKAVDHTMLLKMKEFVNVTQMYFAKQPSRIAKVMQAITQLAADPRPSLENVQNVMGAALKGHPLIMDMFLQVLPPGKPPDILFAAQMFENLTCPVGPHDKNKALDPQELYENVELPVSTPQEDPYGGDSCKCDCHSSGEESKSKGANEHCASCGTRFLNGRIYLQTSEGLRPAKIVFPGADDEKLENISRVSLKTTERIIPGPPSRKRRKSSKGDSISEEPNLKIQCTKNNSPTKDTEESDKSSSKSKKGIKSPPKSTDAKKLVKVAPTSVKSKREKKAEKKVEIDLKIELDLKVEDEQYCTNTDQTIVDEFPGSSTTEDFAEELFGSKLGEISTDSHEDDTSTSPEKTPSTARKVDTCSDSDSSTITEVVKLEDSITNTSWTMQDDQILLENVQKDYSEKTFVIISNILKNRTVEQVKERCQYLLSLLEKMA